MLSLNGLLKENKGDGPYLTHVSLFPTGKYSIQHKIREKFWNLYCEAVSNETPLGIAERPQEYLPVLVDIDLKEPLEDIEPDGKGEFPDYTVDRPVLYTDEDIQLVINAYQEVISNIVDRLHPSELTCVLLEKPAYTETKNNKTYLKNGFHLHFPYIFMQRQHQEVHLIPRVKEAISKEIVNKKIFNAISTPDVNKIIDKNCVSQSWLLYGGSKSSDMDPYKVTHVYGSDRKEMDLEQAFRNYKIYDVNEQEIPIRDNIEYYLPRILSVLPCGRATKEVKKGLYIFGKKKRGIRQNSTQKEVSIDEALKTAGELLPMLSDSRADDRMDWLTIGWTLYCITDGDEAGLDLWKEFSQRCPEKYDEAVCENEWQKATKKGLSLGTLRHFAELDSPVMYKQFVSKKTQKLIIASIGGSHNDIAKLMFEEYGNRFVCASFKNEIWYQYRDHRWMEIEGGVHLREKISGDILRYFTTTIGEISQATSGDSGKQMDKMKALFRLTTDLRKRGFKDCVMKECCEVFYDQTFRDKLDNNPNIIGFANGVYDLKTFSFRKGKPEDYISNALGIRYNEFTEDDRIVQDVFTFLEQVFPDPEVRRYFLDIYSEVFVGGNHAKIVVFWTGGGDNAKSVTQQFFDLMLGPLCVKLNTAVVTGKKPSPGQANADLARTGTGVRLLVLEEPEGDECINSGILKHLSGNDRYFARDLFERGKQTKEIKPMFKLTFVCNKLPRIRHADKALWNRARVIPFESVFCRPENPAPDSAEEQKKQKRFPMDPKFNEKVPEMVEAFAWILLEHRKKPKGVYEPEKVRSATEAYKRQNDVYKQFIEEELLEAKGAKISLSDLYFAYKEWYKTSMPHHTVPIKNEVEDYFTLAWGACQPGKYWNGYRRKTDKDREEAGELVIIEPDDLALSGPRLGGNRSKNLLS